MHVIFVCTGNTCRSPMAEGLFRRAARAAGLAATCESAGVLAHEGQPISEGADEALREIGIDMAAHRARRITRAMAENSDLIVALSPGHLALLQPFESERTGLCLLGSGIDDPYGWGPDAYRETRDAIDRAVAELARDLKRREEA